MHKQSISFLMYNINGLNYLLHKPAKCQQSVMRINRPFSLIHVQETGGQVINEVINHLLFNGSKSPILNCQWVLMHFKQLL